MSLIYQSLAKRFIDLFFSIIALFVLSPFLIISALLIRLSSEGPILFKQKRLGLDSKPFTIYKFRTMTDKPRESKSEIFGKGSEVTLVGYWLRRLKIDEIPQLINIVLGDMSIVGPRPALTEQLDDINKNAPTRLKVKPGLTGLAQVNGNIHLPWSERWLYDIEYTQNISLMLDTKIIFKTIFVVIFGEKHFLKKHKSRHE